ncbi:MAG: asparaginase [Treponema sp.]|nr:asparaginase [Treponema sp.]
MKNILFIATGGTISSLRTDLGLAPGISPEKLIDAVPYVRNWCNVDAIKILDLDSTNMQPEHWLEIADCIREKYDEYDGFVIAHGTDTMAYTGAALSYLIQKPDKPIVLTGSQRPTGTGITDAPKNLLDSFHFCSYCGHGGVFIVFDGKVIVGTRARKVKTRSYDAFESINFPLFALTGDQKIVRYISTEPLSGQTKFFSRLNPKVFLLKLTPGMEPDILYYAVGFYDAIIIESYGSGGLPFHEKRDFLSITKKLSDQGKIFVLATQTMLEGSDLQLYEVGKRIHENAEILETCDMTVEAAVAKLMWILPQTQRFTDVKKLFYTPVNYDICWGV